MNGSERVRDSRHLQTAIAIVFSGLAIAGSAVAEKVRCPVCGEVYSEGEEECPNDGTNLKMFGKREPEEEMDPVAPPASDVDAQKPSDATSAEGGSTDSTSGGEEAPPILYKRHDQGGERKPGSSKESGGYTDRASRLPGSVRVGPAPAQGRETRKRAAPPKRGDTAGDQARSDFENERRDKWLKRPETRLDAGQDIHGKEAARKRLLDHLAAPLASLGVRMLWLGESGHPGPVGLGEIEINFARYRLRVGTASSLGVRVLELRNELVFLQSASVGVQLPMRFTPYLVARGGIGIITTERFNATMVYMMTAVGAEAGIDAWITPWTAVSPTIGYLRCAANNAYWHTVTLKVAIGF